MEAELPPQNVLHLTLDTRSWWAVESGLRTLASKSWGWGFSGRALASCVQGLAFQSTMRGRGTRHRRTTEDTMVHAFNPGTQDIDK